MSITTVNAVYQGIGPTVTGEVLSAVLSGPGAKTLKYTATITGDGSATTFKVNYIDGTATIKSPDYVTAFATGSPATAFAGTVSAASAVTHNVSTGQDDYFTVTISGADTTGHKLTICGEIGYLS